MWDRKRKLGLCPERVFYLPEAIYCPQRGQFCALGRQLSLSRLENAHARSYESQSSELRRLTLSDTSHNSKRYEWKEVKSGEALATTLHPHNPSVYRGFKRKGEEWRVKYKFAWFKLKLYDGNKINHILLCLFEERQYLCTPNAENRAGLRLRFIIHL